MSDHKCRRCGETFSREDKLTRHLRNVHAASNNRAFGKSWLIAVGAGVAIGLLLLVFADDGAVGTTRAANMEAFGLADDPYLGDPEAPVVVAAFEAPKCSACQSFHRFALPELNQTYFAQGHAVLYYSQAQVYPFDHAGGRAQECAYRDGGNAAFWRLTDLIYVNQGSYNEANVRSFLTQLAADQGLDADALVACYDDGETSHLVDQDFRVYREHEVRGTPTFFVFGPELGQVIQDQLAKAGVLPGA
ncbi:MAG: thioredoxin domain-containing protein [Thermoplasmatota archaeon]